MANTYDELSDFPPYVEQRVHPNAVELLLTLNTKITQNFRDGVAPSVDFPSQWRMAKLVVTERAPLIVFHYGESEV